MNQRFLIVNADDYGMMDCVNGAIERLLVEKKITSTTILAPAVSAKKACSWAASRGLSTGVHWTINGEWEEEPWTPAAGEGSVPSLCVNGALVKDAAAASKRAASREVTIELAAQAEFLIRNGVKPDHADSHCGTLYGVNGRLFFINAFGLCKKMNLPFRFPRRGDFMRRQLGGEPGKGLSAAHRLIVGLADSMKVRLIDDFITNPFPAEKINGYGELKAYYDRELRDAKIGVTEVFLHPSLPDDEMRRRTGQWIKREWEYRYLMSDDFQRLIREEGFALCHWGNAPLEKGRKERCNII